jgi:hypothetical protein
MREQAGQAVEEEEDTPLTQLPKADLQNRLLNMPGLLAP